MYSTDFKEFEEVYRSLWQWSRPRWHLRTTNSGQFEAIWNMKTKSEVLSIFRPFSDCWSEMVFFRLPVWIIFSGCQSEINLKQYEAICYLKTHLKLFVPIWNQSKTNLKSISKTHQSEIFHIHNLKSSETYWNHFRSLIANLKAWEVFDYKNKVRERPREEKFLDI